MAVPKSWKENRFHLFVALYILAFGLLAFFGYIEVRHIQNGQQENAGGAAQDKAASSAHKVFYRLPRMDLTLSSLQGETHHARIRIDIEVDKTNTERFVDFQPRVSDRIIDFLRHQDIDAIRQHGAMMPLRRDLLHEVNKASGPVPITDLVFREFVVW